MTNSYEMINGELVQMSDAEQAAFTAMQEAAVSENATLSLINTALSTLTESGITVDRISEAVSLGLTTWVTADVVAWMNYRRALREIIGTKSGTLPTKPPYPAGT